VGELGLVNGYKVVGVTAVVLALVAIVVIADVVSKNSARNSGNMNVTRVDFESLVRLQMREFFNGWNFVVVEHSDVLAKNLQKVLRDENINASVSRVNVLDIVNLSSVKPQMVVFNLLDGEVLEEVKSPETADILRRLVREGVYVFFVTNDSNVIREISTLFDPPLSHPTSSEATITKVYRSGKQELLVVGTLFAVGRTYKNVDGRFIPFDGSVSILLDKPTTMDEAMQRLANELMKSIIAGENSLYRRWR